MKTTTSAGITLYDLEPDTGDFRAEVIAGLTAAPKTLPPKFFYDAEGSQLFDRICELGDYYPTRTELAITESSIGAIVEAVGPRCRVVELGSGSSLKTRILLDNLVEPAAYLPLDISREHLLAAAERLAERYPDLPIHPVCADYSQPVPELPTPEEYARTVVYFPGSTIGNFARDDALAFLTRLNSLAGDGGALLIGVDMKKDEGILHRAYNDSEGVTAAFNLNLLVRINRELDADFDLDRFRHRAIWDEAHGRIEMQLVSTEQQSVRIGEQAIEFGEGEIITTEYSHKYSREEFAELAAQAGFVVRQVWTDERDWFSVQYCEEA